MSWIFLSHFYNQATPGYGGKKDFAFNYTKCLSQGDSCNQIHFNMGNHHGTHIDLPSHFFDNGERLENYAPKQWMPQTTYCLEVSVKEDELLLSSHLKDIPAHLKDSLECLIIKTNFEKYRQETKYWQNNPGLSAELGFFLKKNFKQLRIIGFDFISATAYQNRNEGKKAHQAFLGTETGQPILIIEDMKLAELSTGLISKLIISPLLIEKADGVPVTIFALQENH